jgi:hypothetical protein
MPIVPRIPQDRPSRTPYLFVLVGVGMNGDDRNDPARRKDLLKWLKTNIVGDWKFGRFTYIDIANTGRSEFGLQTAVGFRSIADAQQFERSAWEGIISHRSMGVDVDTGEATFARFTPDRLPHRFLIPLPRLKDVRAWLEMNLEREWYVTPLLYGEALYGPEVIVAIEYEPEAMMFRLAHDLVKYV